MRSFPAVFAPPAADRARGAVLSCPASALAVTLALLAGVTPGAHAAPFAVALRRAVATGSSPAGVAAADLNGDGFLDFVVADESSGTISVFLGNGAGGFGPRAAFAVGTTPVAVAVADLNGDGKPDLAVADLGDNTVSVLLGYGGGGFAPATVYPTGAAPTGLAIADVTGDGRPDLVIADQVGNSISVLPGDGAGGFGARIELATGGAPFAVACGDLDGDGLPDIVAAEADSNTVSVFRALGAGAFGARTDLPTGTYPVALALADLDGDGRLDLVVADYAAGAISVLPGDGAGGFGTRTDFAAGTGPQSVAVADVDADGVPDVVCADFVTGTVSVLPGSASPPDSFGAPVEVPAGSHPFGVAVGDWNQDGALDVLVSDNGADTATVLMGAGSSPFGGRLDYPSGQNAGTLVVADFDRDGWPDAAVLNPTFNTISVLFGDGLGGFRAPLSLATALGDGPDAIACGDLNDDGLPDLVVSYSGCTCHSVFLSLATQGFRPRIDITGSAYPPGGLAVGDVNGDGNADVVDLVRNASEIHWWFGDGMGGLADSGLLLATGALPQAVAAADLGHVGVADVVTANAYANTVSVLRVGSFSDTDFPCVQQPASIAIGDVNGDGDPDLVVGGASDTLSVLFNDGSAGFSSRTDVVAGAAGLLTVAIGDVNADGAVDLVVAEPGGSGIAVLFGDGHGGFGAPTADTTGGGPADPALADVNHDGRPDVVFFHAANGVISVLRGRSRTRTVLATSPDPTPVGSLVTLTATVTGTAAGDTVPTGIVAFTDGTTAIGQAPLYGGVAGLTFTASRPGLRTYSAHYLGDDRSRGSYAMPVASPVVSGPAPSIASVADVPADQGHEVRLRIRPSSLDRYGSATPIVRYDVFRRIPPGAPAAPVAANRAAGPEGRTSVLVDGWDFVGDVYAYADTAYVLVVPTLQDSNATGFNRATFFVRAATAAPSVYYDSAPDSGYSVDNLSPATPTPFVAAYQDGATHLHWGANGEADLAGYRLYRGATSDFAPGPSNLVAAITDTGYVDAGPAGSDYKLTAVDLDGNESAPAEVIPSSTSSVGPGEQPRLALDGVRPDPVVGSTMTVSFTLATSDPATLDLVDVTGRRVAHRDVGTMGAGRHALDLDSGGTRPGLYFLRLAQDGRVRVARAIVVR